MKLFFYSLILLLFLTSLYENPNSGLMPSKIYTVGRIFVFRASFFDSKNKLICQEEVKLKIIGGQKGSALNQFKARWEYEAYPNLDTNLTIGITEDSKFIFLHQPRDQKYLFTEICGFPSVHLPIYEKLNWQSTIKIPLDSDIYGEYQGWIVKTKSKVIGVSFINALQCDSLKTWEIHTKSKHRKGSNRSILNFNDEFGFVRMYFKHYDETSLIMDLLNII